MKRKLIFLAFALCLISPLLAFSSQTKTFSTKDHPQSKGLDLTIEYPSHWVEKTGDRPHVVRKFQTEYPCFTNCMLIVLDIPWYQPVNPQNDFSAATMRRGASKLGQFIDCGQAKYDGEPGGWVTYSSYEERFGLKAVKYSISQNFYYGRKSISIICDVMGPYEESPNLRSYFDQQLSTFFLIGNSVVIQSKWGKPHHKWLKTLGKEKQQTVYTPSAPQYPPSSPSKIDWNQMEKKALGQQSTSATSAHAALNKHKARVGEEIRLTITVTGSSTIESPRLPSLTGFDTYYTGRASHIKFVNGVSTSTVEFSYTLVPNRPGIFTLPPINISGARTEEIMIEIA